MWKPLVAGLFAQVPLRSPDSPPAMSTVPTRAREFALRTGPDVFAPKDLIELARPSTGTPNEEGTLVFNTVAQYSFESKKYVLRVLCRNED